jgi:hypothetical protein
VFQRQVLQLPGLAAPNGSELLLAPGQAVEAPDRRPGVLRGEIHAEESHGLKDLNEERLDVNGRLHSQ